MSTYWFIQFVGGGDTIQCAETIQEAMTAAEFRCNKQVRLAVHWSDDQWGFGFGEMSPYLKEVL